MVSKPMQNVVEKAAVGLGVAAAVAATAGAIFLYGTKAGARERKKIKGWALKLKGEVVEKLEGAQEFSEEVYNTVVDTTAKKYEGLKKVDPQELAAVVKELKGHWRNIKRQMTGGKGKKKRSSR